MKNWFDTIPADERAERALLGAALLSPEALSLVIEKVTPDDFFNINNKDAFEVILDMNSKGAPVDLVTFASALEERKMFDKIGGQPYLASLIQDIRTTGNVDYYAEILATFSLKRRVIQAARRIENIAYEEFETAKLINKTEKIILEALVMQNSDRSAPMKLSELTPIVKDKITSACAGLGATNMRGFTTELSIDNYTNGFQPGSLNILAARPSMGKTALALNIAQFGKSNTGEQEPCVLFFSLEMPAEKLVFRMLAAESKIDMNNITAGILNDAELKEITKALDEINRKNVFIKELSELSIINFRTQCRRFKMQHPELNLIVVDYLQLMNSGNTARYENRVQEVSEISRILKATARELNCPVLALSQLSREAERRNDRRPQLSDLRDSGAIEQDADVVMLLFREDYYDKDKRSGNPESLVEVNIAKNRNGDTGNVYLTFKKNISLFTNNNKPYGENWKN